MFDIPVLKHTFFAIIIIIASGFVGQLLKIVLGTFFKRLLESTKATIDDRILFIIKSRVVTLSVLLGIFIGIGEVRKGLSLEDLTYTQVLDCLSIGLYIGAIFIITRLISRLIRISFEWYIDEIAIKNKSNVVSTVVPLLMKITNIVLFLIAGMIILDHFGVNIGSLIVSLGVGSLAVALAAQETVANMIAGFVILVDQPFRIGDRIKLPSGDEGDVHQIGLRSTRILNFDNNLLVVPNSELIKNHITNFSFPSDEIRILVEVNVAYGTDIEKAKKILMKIVEAEKDILKKPSPNVYLTNFGDSSIQLRIVGRTTSFGKKFEIETALREQIYKKLRKEGIEIAIPQRIIHLVNSNGAKGYKTK